MRIKDGWLGCTCFGKSFPLQVFDRALWMDLDWGLYVAGPWHKMGRKFDFQSLDAGLRGGTSIDKGRP